jgi:hypothetical protein
MAYDWSGSFSNWANSGDMWTMAASALLGGVSASSSARQSDKDREREYQLRRELAELEARSRDQLARTTGDETRRTIDFESRLNESNRLNERARLSTAWDAWKPGGGKPAAKPVAAPRFQDYYVAPPVQQPLPPKG